MAIMKARPFGCGDDVLNKAVIPYGVSLFVRHGMLLVRSSF